VEPADGPDPHPHVAAPLAAAPRQQAGDSLPAHQEQARCCPRQLASRYKKRHCYSLYFLLFLRISVKLLIKWHKRDA
jgi:hypothetical protein